MTFKSNAIADSASNLEVKTIQIDGANARFCILLLFWTKHRKELFKVRKFSEEINSKLNEPALTTQHLESIYGYNNLKSENVLRATGKYMKKYYAPSRFCCQNFVAKTFPISVWLPKYDMKQNLMKDIVGGLTVYISQSISVRWQVIHKHFLRLESFKYRRAWRFHCWQDCPQCTDFTWPFSIVSSTFFWAHHDMHRLVSSFSLADSFPRSKFGF